MPRESASRLEIPATVVDKPTVALIEINSASVTELERLPGVGSGLAARIVAHRAQFGPFRRVEHLMMVRGISEKKFQVLQRYIEVR